MESQVEMSVHKKGFTLIELLVVMAIIAVLTGLMTVSFVSVRQRSRDAQRKSDIQQIQSALAQYLADNDSYPASSPTSPFASCGQQFRTAATVYLSKIPCDPLSGLPYYYSAAGSGTPVVYTSYIVATCIENNNDASKTTTPPTGMTCTPANYYVANNP